MTSMTPANDRAFAAAAIAPREAAPVALPAAPTPQVSPSAARAPDTNESSARARRISTALRQFATAALSNILPPLAVVALLLLVWEMAAGGPASGLPSPLQIWTDA